MGVNFNLSFNHLPTELQVAIFSLLPEKDLGMAALVSKPWKQLAEDPFLWKKLFCRRWSNLTQIKTSRFGWKKIYKKSMFLESRAPLFLLNIFIIRCISFL
ncbi:hypothetical protein DB41_KI00020 [Neochlamydia sp. TUME1]|uniref:F-box protein n=1 Tax=Neochlamydia sp. TUME1 TaxID=1478174 RepID=UPI0005800980|nr:F-box protein [Neochlamydia sp. TUME1]KIC72558.1 hypothetical protein DB41_KI00020 [Neochlamydia sp. TUME1]